MKQYIVFLFTIFFAFNVFAQQNANIEELFAERVEVYFEFEVAEEQDLAEVARLVSIDHGEWGKKARAYANEREFKAFLSLDLPYKILPPPSTLIQPNMLNVKQWKAKKSSGEPCVDVWDFYPTYEAYETILTDFVAAYPDISRIEEFGVLPSGRKLLAVVISDNVYEKEAEPQFLYTSSMHGDEIAGYPMMLQLIDHLLCSYQSDERITEMIDNMEIWINPLANPDGTYTNNNETVFGATRYNSEGYDLNRNYPDPIIGNVPVNQRPMQTETEFFVALAEANDFVLSANFHGGTEVLNYPWDTQAERHADDVWWECISLEYVEKVKEVAPSTYFDGFGDGVTNGYDWYHVDGARQDFMTYFHHGREITIELSDQKLLNASQLGNHWEYNKESLLDFMERALQGFQGVVTDAVTGEPIDDARIFIRNHDFFNSDVYSNPQGYYSRPIEVGTYDLVFSAPDYLNVEFNGLAITKKHQKFQLDVSLMPEITSIEGRLQTNGFLLYPNPAKNSLFLKFENTVSQLQVFDITGKIVRHLEHPQLEMTLDISDLKTGMYWVKAVGTDWSRSQKLVIEE